MYVLYHFPYSQHARRVVSLLEAAKLPYELRHVDMASGAHLSAAYLAINPNHQVPTLIDGDLVLHEFERDPALSLPQAWLDRLVSGRSRASRAGGAMAGLEPVPPVAGGHRHRAQQAVPGRQGRHGSDRAWRGELRELAPILDAGLAAQDFLTGPKPTIADLAVASNLFQLGLAKASPPGAHTAAWYQRMGTLDAFRKSLPPT